MANLLMFIISNLYLYKEAHENYKLIEKTQNRVEYTDEDMLDDMSKFSRELTL